MKKALLIGVLFGLGVLLDFGIAMYSGFGTIFLLVLVAVVVLAFVLPFIFGESPEKRLKQSLTILLTAFIIFVVAVFLIVIFVASGLRNL